MSRLHVNQIKRHLETTYVPHLNASDIDQQHHRLSRAVAAFAIAERTGLSTLASCASVTDDYRDNGLDAVAFAADRSTLVLVQSKWTENESGVTSGDVLKYLEGVKALMNSDWAPFGGPILERRGEIEDILFQPGTRVELVIATTTQNPIAEQQRLILDRFCAEMNDASEIAAWTYLDQSRIYAAIASQGNSPIDLTVTLRNWGSYQETGCVAYYGTVAAQDVVEWHREHGELLFSRNIRGALSESEINDGIARTATSDPTRFWFFNNGITVVAESLQQAPYVNQKSGKFTFSRASIVNGAQTVTSLDRAAGNSPELLESADVFIRFVTVDDPDGEFARLVTRRTNSQNRVGGREFVALDPEQERLRMEFAVSGLRYAYRSGESLEDANKGCDLQETTIALACGHGISEATLAKREISRMWEDTSKAPYTSLFNSKTTASRVWHLVQVMRAVDSTLAGVRQKYEGRDRLIVVHGNRLILWGVIRSLQTELRELTDLEAHPVDREVIAGHAERLANELVQSVATKFADSYPQPLFKNQTKCRELGQSLFEGSASEVSTS